MREEREGREGGREGREGGRVEREERDVELASHVYSKVFRAASSEPLHNKLGHQVFLGQSERLYWVGICPFLRR